MGNRLFQLAKSAVHNVETSVQSASSNPNLTEVQAKIKVAKNELSSAFANSSFAEKQQLQELQQRLDKAQESLTNFDNTD
ncbi:DUF3813 domain-containing protein [Calidifontibacillus oryziterrae]|uniref:DUF3813 domain-containing protein n=1 Tax=Calidifontibacillus oryziterrae TaxID=1191699 RepID=UPI0002EEBC80|nr:DUF3813 domain-containing protein [Calidifontibacillus oryziterrae]